MNSAPWLVTLCLMTASGHRAAPSVPHAPAPPPAVPPKKPAPVQGVDWEKGVLFARGVGPPTLWKVPGRLRPAAEGAAMGDALAHLSEVAGALPWDEHRTLGEVVRGAGPDALASAVQDASVRTKRWFSDGGAGVELEVPIASVLSRLGLGAPVAAGVAPRFIVDARGKGLVPRLAPIIEGAKGERLFGEDASAPTARWHPVRYFQDLPAALRSPGASARLPVLRATSVAGAAIRLTPEATGRWAKESMAQGEGLILVGPETSP